MTPDQEVELRRRQRSRSRVTAILLGLFVVLMFGISMAKMLINQ
jgi:cobalt transporter subunit CbtB